MPDWLTEWEQQTLAPADALARYDMLATVEPDAMLGVWAGTVLRTGHPFDRPLAGIGWAGKRFDNLDQVHPLMFGPKHAPDRWRAVNPARIPLGLAMAWPGVVGHPAALWLARSLSAILTTRHPTARLRQIQHRGALDAAMVYDRLPIIDCFRRIDAGRMLGVMDLRGQAQPLFFVLTRVG